MLKYVDKIIWSLIGIAASIALVSSVFGWYKFELAAGHTFSLALVSNVVTRTAYFFAVENVGFKIPNDSYWLLIGQALAPIASFSALVRAGVQLFISGVEAYRVRRKKNHSIVCGLGSSAIAFVKSEQKRGQKVVLIGEHPDNADIQLAHLHGYKLVAGDPTDPLVLEAAGLRAATRLITAMDEDGKNLEIATQAKSIVGRNRNLPAPLLTSLSILNRRLCQQIVHSGEHKKNAEQFQLLPFNPGIVAARLITWDQAIWDYAKIRDQARIHIMFVGYDDYTEALIGQLPSAILTNDYEYPQFTLLTPNPIEAERKINHAFPELRKIAELTVIQFEPDTDQFDAELQTRTITNAPVTAIFVCQPTEEGGLGVSVHFQEMMRINRICLAPIYLRTARSDGISDLITSSRKAQRFEDVIQSFGEEGDICDLGTLEGEMEKNAQKFHTGYRAARESELIGREVDRNSDALSEWRGLSETFRISNRRATDHIRAKLHSAGFFVPPGQSLMIQKSEKLANSPEIREMLGELEHRSWMIGRLIEGWTFSTQRNDVRKRHPNLIPYEQLDQETKDYDRRQIDLIDDKILNKQPDTGEVEMIRPDMWLGLVGKNRLNSDEANWLYDELIHITIPKLVAKYPSVHWTIATPLAPGSDLIMAQAVIKALNELGRPYRLLMIEALPEAAMISAYLENYTDSDVWRHTEFQTNKRENVGISEQIRIERAHLMRGDEDKKRTESWIIDIADPNADYAIAKNRTNGFEKASDYITQKCSILMASHRPGVETDIPALGGVEATLKRRIERDELSGKKLQTYILNLEKQTLEKR